MVTNRASCFTHKLEILADCTILAPEGEARLTSSQESRYFEPDEDFDDEDDEDDSEDDEEDEPVPFTMLQQEHENNF